MAGGLATGLNPFGGGGSGLPRWAKYQLAANEANANGGILGATQGLTLVDQDASESFSAAAGGVITPPAGLWLVRVYTRMDTAGVVDGLFAYVDAAGGTPATLLTDGRTSQIHPSMGSNFTPLGATELRVDADGTLTFALKSGTSTTGTWYADSTIVVFDERRA